MRKTRKAQKAGMPTTGYGRFGHSKFLYALDNFKTEEIRQILAGYELPPPRELNDALYFCAEQGYDEIFTLLLRLPLYYGVNPGEDNNRVLRTAVDNGHINIVIRLLSLPPDRGVEPLLFYNGLVFSLGPFGIAVSNGNIDMVNLFLRLPPERGINLEILKMGLRIANAKGHIQIADILRAKIKLLRPPLPYRNVPKTNNMGRPTESFLTMANIMEGNDMVNFPRTADKTEYNFDKYYTAEAYDSIAEPKLHPLTRNPINAKTVTHYAAHLVNRYKGGRFSRTGRRLSRT